MLAIGLVAAIVYLFNTTQKSRQVALNKGVEEDNLTLFAVFLWLYAFPPVVTFLFVQDYNILLALIFIAFYVPGIVSSRKLSVKLGKGYDYERKAGREFDKAMWLGLAGIGIVVLNWIFFSLHSLMQNRQAP
jgi:ABC-type antimicrobial peptide transport system permease subunit